MKPVRIKGDDDSTAPRSNPRCNHCGYYYITWQVNMPYGCRAMNFKSKRMPPLDVLEVDGEPCASFEYKVPTSRRAKAKRLSKAVLGANLSIKA